MSDKKYELKMTFLKFMGLQWQAQCIYQLDKDQLLFLRKTESDFSRIYLYCADSAYDLADAERFKQNFLDSGFVIREFSEIGKPGEAYSIGFTGPENFAAKLYFINCFGTQFHFLVNVESESLKNSIKVADLLAGGFITGFGHADFDATYKELMVYFKDEPEFIGRCFIGGPLICGGGRRRLDLWSLRPRRYEAFSRTSFARSLNGFRYALSVSNFNLRLPRT